MNFRSLPVYLGIIAVLLILAFGWGLLTTK